MKRAKEDRGKDKWERIDWDEAVAIVEEKTHYMWENYGGESIMMFTETGRETCQYSGPPITTLRCSLRTFFYQCGISCYSRAAPLPTSFWVPGIPNGRYAQFFPDRYDDPRYTLPEVAVVWGEKTRSILTATVFLVMLLST